MTKTSDDNGRYFEYLVSKELQDKYKVLFTQKAKIDQKRDSIKNIDLKTKNGMTNGAKKIAYWCDLKITLNNKTLLDRLPDKIQEKKTHEDISLVDEDNKILSFSLKHNHDAIFHGRIGSCVTNNWLNMKNYNKTYLSFEINKRELINELHKSIPIGTEFAGAFLNNTKRKGVKKIYQQIWGNFIFCLHEEVKKIFNNQDVKKSNVEYLFDKIIGGGSNQFRVLKKGNEVIVQDLNNLKIPTKVSVKNIQKINKDPRSSYVWHLVLKFNNGVIISGRTKQDSKFMSKSPKIKTDWRVEDWGESGMVEEIIEINQESLI